MMGLAILGLLFLVLARDRVLRPHGPCDCLTCGRRCSREPWESECVNCQIRYVP